MQLHGLPHSLSGMATAFGWDPRCPCCNTLGSLVFGEEMKTGDYSYSIKLHDRMFAFLVDRHMVYASSSMHEVAHYVRAQIEEAVREISDMVHPVGKVSFTGDYANDKIRFASQYVASFPREDELGRYNAKRLRDQVMSLEDTLATVRAQLVHANHQNALLGHEIYALKQRLAPKPLIPEFGQPAPRRLLVA